MIIEITIIILICIMAISEFIKYVSQTYTFKSQTRCSCSESFAEKQLFARRMNDTLAV